MGVTHPFLGEGGAGATGNAARSNRTDSTANAYSARTSPSWNLPRDPSLTQAGDVFAQCNNNRGQLGTGTDVAWSTHREYRPLGMNSRMLTASPPMRRFNLNSSQSDETSPSAGHLDSVSVFLCRSRALLASANTDGACTRLAERFPKATNSSSQLHVPACKWSASMEGRREGRRRVWLRQLRKLLLHTRF